MTRQVRSRRASSTKSYRRGKPRPLPSRRPPNSPSSRRLHTPKTSSPDGLEASRSWSAISSP